MSWLFCFSYFRGKAQKLSEKEKQEYLGGNKENYNLSFYENLEKGATKSELAITLAPKFEIKRYWVPHEHGRPVKNNKAVGSMENEKIADKLTLKVMQKSEVKRVDIKK